MKKKFFTCLCCLFSYFIFSQNIIKGNVKNDENKVITNASVTITEVGNDNIIAYNITNIRGEFLIEVPISYKKIQINIRAINYVYISKEISNETQTLNFSLIPKETELKEVVVKQNAIRKKGDTLSYSVKEFADQKDRSIADVLAKMPGIEVLNDGKVLYQGKAIQKYYIEGMDLLEGKYNLANNNLPYESVSAVQILENHQPIKILDSLIPTDRTSLNIKLKKKIAYTGTAKLGIGYEPLLWEANITPMLFSKKQQLIASYQSNNIGNDVSQELKTHTLESLMELYDSPTQKNDLLNIISNQTPQIDKKRYLNNNIHLASLNFLKKIKKDVELKINVSYINDYQKEQGNNRTDYFLSDKTISLNENINNNLYYNSLQTDIILEQNTNKTFLKNSFKTEINWEKQKGILKNDTETVNQNLENPFYSFTNQLKIITPFKKQLVTVYSFINFNRAPQSLKINIGLFPELVNNSQSYSETRQDVEQVKFQTNHYISFTKSINNISFSNKIGIKTLQQITNSNLYKDGDKLYGMFENQNNNSNIESYIKPTVYFKKNGWNLSIDLPLSFNSIVIKDKFINQNDRKSIFLFNPYLTIFYENSAYWKFVFGLGNENKFENMDNILYSYLLTNYRNIQKNIYPIEITKNYSSNIGAYYRNPKKSLFFNINYTSSLNKNPYLFNSQIESNGSQQISIINIENTSTSQSANTKLSKYFSSIKSTLTVGFNYNNNTAFKFLNNEKVKSRFENYNPNIKINSRLTDKFSFDFIVNTSLLKNKTAQNNSSKIYTINNVLKAYFYTNDNNYLGFTFEHYYNDNAKNNNIFTDLIYRYTFIKKKIDLELKVTNIFNEKEFETSQFSDFYFYQSVYNLRQRQFLTSIKFSF